MHPVALSSFPSLSQPFTKRTLQWIRSALVAGTTQSQRERASTSAFISRGDAAVLIPFCNVNNIPGILLQVRGKNLRSHSGEVSFPGGRVDTIDKSVMHAALRETEEEVGILPSAVEVLGEIGPPEINLRGDMRVWPFVGFVHNSKDYTQHSDTDPLPSLDLLQIAHSISRAEVETVFHLPLLALASPARKRRSRFRDNEPYWAINVDDLIPEDGITRAMAGNDVAIEGSALEVWGLTGWYLNILMRTLGVYKD